jgi:hypothetical protein
MSDVAVRAHVAPGRIRFRIPGRRGDEAYFRRTLESLATCPGVEGLRANPLTASILVLHHGDPDAIEHFAEAAGLFEAGTPPPNGRPSDRASGSLVGLATTVDQSLLRLTEGRVDLRAASIAWLASGAAVQMARGRMLPPATTLAWYLYQLLRRKGE